MNNIRKIKTIMIVAILTSMALVNMLAFEEGFVKRVIADTPGVNDPPIIVTQDVTKAIMGVLYEVDYDAKDTDRGTPTISSKPDLPTPRAWMGYTWNGKAPYLIGGTEVGTIYSDILEWENCVGSMAVGGGLPPGRYGASAIWNGTYLYGIGGKDDSASPAGHNIKFDPETGTTTNFSTANWMTSHHSAIFTGQYGYIFGGVYDVFPQDRIWRFDLINESLTELGVTLPSESSETSAVFDGRYAYIFGGYLSDEIVKFDTVDESVSVLSAHLPAKRAGTSATWDGDYAHIFGGYNQTTYFDEIVRFEPITENVTVLPVTLPSGRFAAASVSDGWSNHYIYGGINESGYIPDNITITFPRDTLIWSLTTDALFLSIDSQTGILSGTPLPDEVGTYWVNVTVNDGNGGIDFRNFSLSVESAITLNKGLNLVSLPAIQSDPELETVLQSIDGDYNSVKWYDSSDDNDPWKNHITAKPSNMNDLQELDHTMGFWVHITNSSGATLSVGGAPPSSPQNISLSKGWNMVGYPSLSTYNQTAALNNLVFGIHVDSLWAFDAATQTWEELGPTDNFALGKGYWIHATQNCMWEVPL